MSSSNLSSTVEGLREHERVLLVEQKKIAKKQAEVAKELNTVRSLIQMLERRGKYSNGQGSFAFDTNGELKTPSSSSLPTEYPFDASQPDKIIFAIRFKDRFLHKSEIETFLNEHEATVNTNTLSYNLSTMVKDGRLESVSFNNGSNYVFYGIGKMVSKTDGVKSFADKKYKPRGEVTEGAREETAAFK